jgi:hypothetical protein
VRHNLVTMMGFGALFPAANASRAVV